MYWTGTFNTNQLQLNELQRNENQQRLKHTEAQTAVHSLVVLKQIQKRMHNIYGSEMILAIEISRQLHNWRYVSGSGCVRVCCENVRVFVKCLKCIIALVLHLSILDLCKRFVKARFRNDFLICITYSSHTTLTNQMRNLRFVFGTIKLNFTRINKSVQTAKQSETLCRYSFNCHFLSVQMIFK